MAYSIADFQVELCDPASLDSSAANYKGLQPATITIAKGFQKSPAHRPFSTATVLERDIAIPLRDGTVIRGDVYRPADTEENVPALVAWSPYGKSGTGVLSLDIIPGRIGVSQSKNSGFESFEAPDPAVWTARGYAIVNINSRGAFDSEDDIRWFATGEGRDGYDAIEHLATLPWCSGKVAMAGNSWLAMAQWFIAAEQPPHLTCIAPFEGASDFYRETLCRGGVPFKPFWSFLAREGLRNQQEDVVAMIEKYPLVNKYWEDKRARVERIKVPAYVLASYSTILHTVGSLRSFEDLPNDQKWLRIHPTQEWYDLYADETVQEMQLFFDHFLKGKQNGWDKTPRVRVSVLQYNKDPEYNHVFNNYPVPATDYRTLYLSPEQNLLAQPLATDGSLSYQSDVPTMQIDAQEEELSFEHTFEHRTYLVGYSKAVLYMFCAKSDDMDIFVQLRKADRAGNVLQNINIPLQDLKMEASEVPNINPLKYIGPMGILRASHRNIDRERSKPHWPMHSHEKEGKITPGQVVEVTIGIWPAGIVFDVGEKLVFRVSGHPMTLAEFEPLRGKWETQNKGRHEVHMGKEHPSYIVVPFVKV